MDWSDISFVEYLNAVDETLDAYFGFTSDQDELEFISGCHEENAPPDMVAFRLNVLRADR